MHPYSILMFCFSGALLLYAGLLAFTGDCDMIPKKHAAKPKDPRAYARAFARMLAVVALAPMSSGFLALFHPALGAALLVPDFAACIWIGMYFFRGM